VWATSLLLGARSECVAGGGALGMQRSREPGSASSFVALSLRSKRRHLFTQQLQLTLALFCRERCLRGSGGACR